jgi:UDP-N-acetylmuramoylalanine--D-glutamate ligase
VGVTRWLAHQGAVVTVTDRAEKATLRESVQALGDLDIRLLLGRHDPADLESTDLAIINPAVNKTRSELFQAIIRRGIAWTTEMNLFCERCPAPVIGVTGSFGKSTICAMLADALREGSRAGDVTYTGIHLGGNIGRSLLPILDEIQPADLVVLELSDAQLVDLPRIDWAPFIAVVCNIQPHHLDRYDSFADYARAKLNIVGPPRTSPIHKMPKDGYGPLFVGPLEAQARAILDHVLEGSARRVIQLPESEPRLKLSVPGDHNQANARYAYAVCRELGVSDPVARRALQSYRGLPHRLELVRRLHGAMYYNDSKSTSPAAIIQALNALPKPIIAVVGGQLKPASLEDCAHALGRSCRTVICTGESGSAFALAIRAVHPTGRAGLVIEASDLADAVLQARDRARPGDVVLYSPGAPSFDAFANYEERGRRFVALVRALV